MAEKTYWAAEPLESFLPKVAEKRDAYYRQIQLDGRLQLWREMTYAAYPALRSRGQIGEDGDASEFLTINANELGNLKSHVHTMVTGQKLYPEAKAKNTDHRSQQQTILGQGIAETALREKGLEDVAFKVADYAISYGAGWGGKFWSRDLGEEFIVDDMAPPPMLEDPALDEMGQPIPVEPPAPQILRSGDILYRAFTPADVVNDVHAQEMSDPRWLICRIPENKWDLIALFPAFAEEIEKLPSIKEDTERYPRLNDAALDAETDSDDVWVWYFFHKKCPSIPEGRQVRFVSEKLALEDGPLEYRELPLYRMSVQDVPGTTIAYATLFDVLAPQSALDSILSSAITNQAAFGMPSVWIPEGCVIEKTEIGKALTLLTGGTTKPEPIEWATTPPETFKLFELIERLMETLSGVNPVVRGNPEANLKSGTALALVQAQAIQFVTTTKMAYVLFVSKVLTGTVRDYQQFAEVPHVITITGQAKRQVAIDFTKDDIDQLDTVTVDIGNPLQGTIAGRSQMAETLVQARLVSTPEQYIQVLTTGRLEPLTDATQQELLNIKSENERLALGEPCQAIYTDNHPIHIREHAAVLASPEARLDDAVVEAVHQHLNDPVQGHAALWRTTDPAILMALGIRPPPPPPGMMGPEEGQPQGDKKANGDPRKEPALPGDKNVSQPMGPGMEQASDMGMPMPSMPKPPATGAQAAQIGMP